MEAELRARKEGADGEARAGLRRWEPELAGEGARSREAEGAGPGAHKPGCGPQGQGRAHGRPGEGARGGGAAAGHGSATYRARRG